MNTRNRNNYDREFYGREYRNAEPFDEFRGYRESDYDSDRSYYSGRENYYPSRNDRNWDSLDPRDNYDRDREWENFEREDERNSWYENDLRSSYFERSERNPYYLDQEEPRRGNTYKGRYYGRHESPQDLADIRHRYEESRRQASWSSAYLPQNNW